MSDDGGSAPDGHDSWFVDAGDAGKYIGEVGRLWLLWLIGLGALGVSRGGTAVVVGIALLLAMFVFMHPLQQRVQARYGTDADARRVQAKRSISARDRALRELTYGRKPFAEAVEKRQMWPGLKAVPWVVIAATLGAAAFVAIAWFEG